MEGFSCTFLSDEDRTNLVALVFEDEIKQGLWALKPFKAPGADGLHAGFFQFFWANVKTVVCREVTNIFESKIFPKYLNDTLISLIPKGPNPKSLNNYRPISLCNTIYKIVSKIVVGRLKPHLDKLISPNQAAFVPGRQGLDNIVIAQDLLHSLDTKKGKVGFMAVKVDLAKAYDRLEWVKGYMRNIGVATNITAEFWALRDDLILASQLEITQLLVELDAKVVVDLVLSRKPSNSPYSSLLNDCRFLLNRF